MPTPSPSNSRADHLAWCKERALAYCARNNLAEAWASFTSDMGKHPETAGHVGIQLGTMLLLGGHLRTPAEMCKHIEGFN